MNRKARIYFEKQNEKIMLTENELQKIINTKTKEAIEVAFELSYCVCALALNNEFNFGFKRLKKFFERYNKEMACINYGSLTKNDVENFLKEKNIDFIKY